jgi:hypothetical protein
MIDKKWQKELEEIWNNMIKQQMPEERTDSTQDQSFHSLMMNEEDFLFCGLKSTEIYEI